MSFKYWETLKETIQPAQIIQREIIKKNNNYTIETIDVEVANQRLTLQYLAPRHEPVSTLVMLFSDLDNIKLSWFSLQRYAAYNMAVVTVPYQLLSGSKTDRYFINQLPSLKLLHESYLVAYALSISSICQQVSQLAVVGVGVGASVAAAVSALNENITQCCLKDVAYVDLNALYEQQKLPDVTMYFKAFDPQHQNRAAFFDDVSVLEMKTFAPYISAHILSGRCGLNDRWPAAIYDEFSQLLQTQETAYFYPKHVHELVNHYEDQTLLFLMPPRMTPVNA